MDLTLNTYLFSLIIAICNLVLTALLLLLLRGKHRANWLLAVFLILLALSFFSDIIHDNGLFYLYPHALGYDHFINLTIGPLLYLYIRIQTRPDQGLRALDGLHLMPLLLHGLLLSKFLLSDTDTKLATIPYIGMIANYNLADFLLKVQDLIYILAGYRLLARHNRIIEDVLSSPDNRRLKWLQHLLVAATVLFMVWVITNVISTDLTSNGKLLGLTLLIFSYWVAYKALAQELIFDQIATETIKPIFQQEQPEQRYRNSTLTPAAIGNIGTQLVRFMEESKPYLDPTLSLTSLSTQLNVNPNHLSQVLNESFNQNFYNFINRYRVEESKRLLLDKAFAHYSILAIAEEAGFNSKSTFNRVFRDVVGIPPSEYVKQQQSV